MKLRSMKLRTLPLVVGLALVAAGCGRGQASIVPATVPRGSSPTVVIHQMAFKPGNAPVAHNVTFVGFSSPNQATGSWSHTFTSVGVYPYRCTDHLDMVGVVTVLP
jgi:hypothetical protein